MDILESAIKAFERMLSVKYEIILGRKGKTSVLNISFRKEDFFHLAGLHYLVDVPKLKTSRDIIFDSILKKDDFRNILLSSQFIDKIERRIKYLIELEKIIDSNDTVFKIYQLQFSKIKADYILVNEIGVFKLYLFIKRLEDDNYICTFFSQNETVDYTLGQLKTTILFKKKNINSNESYVFIDKITPKN